jgi:LCP family protein required for cell wall assembly
MEDGSGGLSVADLVQRHHTGSRPDLPSINPDATGHHAMPPAGQPVPRRHPGEDGGQDGRRPGEPGPQWPDQHPGQHPDAVRRVAPPAPGQNTGHRAMPEPPGYPPADLPPVQATGRRAMPDDLHIGDRLTPGHRALPDEGFGPGHGMPDDGYGPAGHRAAPDDGDGFGQGGHRVPPGQASGSYPVPPAPGQFSGGRGLPPGAATGRRAMPDDGFGPGRPVPDDNFGPPARPMPDSFGPGAPLHDNGFGPGAAPDHGFGPGAAPDNGFGPGAPDGFGPGAPMRDNGFGPGAAPDNGFGPGAPDGFGPGAPMRDNGFGPGAAPDNGFGPGAAPDNDFGPGTRPDRGFGRGAPMPDNGFGPGAPMPDNGFGPGAPDGFGPGGPMPDESFGPADPGGFGPGQHTGHRALPDLPPGQRSGSYPVPPAPGQSSGGRGLPPGQNTGNYPLPPAPGQNTGNYPVPPTPGQNTGRRPMPEDPRGPGQASGYRALPGRPLPGDPAGPGPNGRPPGDPMGRPSGPIPGDPMGRPSGPIPGDPMANGRHPSGPIQRPAGPPPGPREPMADDQAANPPGRPGPTERPVGERSQPPRPSEAGAVPLPPPRRPADAISMTTEMEAIGEDVQKRRGIDHTLARFSAVHDEIQAEERERKAKRRKLMRWRQDDGEMDQLDELVANQTISVSQKPPEQAPEPEPEPGELVDMIQDDDGPTRLQEKKTRRRKLAVRVFAATAAILVFVATGLAWGFKSWVDASSQQVDALDPNSDAIQDAAKQRGDENFLLVGSDTRAGAEAEDGVGDENEVVGARSDTVMIAHIPADRERAVVVSFPRDLEVTRPACEGWDPKSGDYTGEQKPAEDQVKLNTAYQVGGPKCVTKMVQQLSGLMINHFVGIDFHGFKGMVDAVRGVQVCVEQPLKDDILGTVVPVAGKNVTLTGDQALNFVRARHVQGDLTSDYGRIKRQQRFLSSLLRKAMSSEVLLDPGKLTDFVDAFSKSTFGDNIGIDQMLVLGQSLQGINAGKVTFITVPTVGEANDRGNEDLRTDDTKSLFSAIREDTPLPGESNGGTQQLRSGLLQAQPSGPVDPKTIKLQVLNGGNPTGGIAGQTADQLTELGYQIVWVDAAPDKVDRTIIKYAKGREAQAQTLKASVPGAELVEDPSVAGAVQLIIGPGFDGKVVAPGKGGKPADPLPEDLSTINGGDVSCA